jgi:hypothetical protein
VAVAALLALVCSVIRFAVVRFSVADPMYFFASL